MLAGVDPLVVRRPARSRGARGVRGVGEGARAPGRPGRHLDGRRLAAARRRRAARCRGARRGWRRSPWCCSPSSRSAHSSSTGGSLPERPSAAVDCRPCSGAWPSGKATGFGPVIPGSNPGAPAIDTTPTMPTRLAAVVMAGGLGTRMRSVARQAPAPDPGTADGGLGRRGGAAARRRIHSSSSRRPRHGDAFTGLEVAVQREPLGTGDAVRSAARGGRRTRTRCSCSPATRRCSPPSSSRVCSTRIETRTRLRPSSRSSRTTC